MKPLSLIVPTLNEELYLPRLLQSIAIAAQHYTAPIQVIIVDGQSTDKTLQVARSFKARLPGLEVHTTPRGAAAQRNFGARKASYETLVFSDADMEFTPNSLSAINARLHHKANFIAMPLIYPYDGKLIDTMLGTISYAYFFIVQRFSPVVSGMCILTTKSVHASINGFDEKLRQADDIDYGLRAIKAGAKHYIFLSVRVRASARRLNTDGRLTTALTWLRWHRLASKNRKLLYQPANNYEFGKFRKH